MKDTQDIQEASKARQSEVHKQEDEVEKQEQSGDKPGVPLVIQRSSVHFFPKTSSDSTTLTFSQSSSNERPLNYYPSQISGVTVSTIGPLTSKGTTVSGSSLVSSKEVSCLLGSKKHALLSAGPESPVIGEGEDYFLSLFGNPKKLTEHSSYTEKTYKHFSMILEEVGHSTSSSLGDIKIAEVNIKGLFVKLVNSSLDKELTIGDHFLQQNVNGQRVSLYRFLPNIVMQANATVTVWAAASEAKHQPPSDFLWKEQNKFITSPDCTTILCKPNGQAVAWYTLIHWKQAWEKLETDIEFDRSSIVSPKFRKHMFQWAASTTTVTMETEDQPKKDTSKCQLQSDQVFIKREKEIPPTLFPNRSPWCQSPFAPAHPYSPLIEPYSTGTAGSRLSRQPRSQSTRPDPAPGTKKKKTSELQKQDAVTQPLKDNNIQV
ncbi:lamin tail domain-containing protein 1 isoform X1 [Lemur catta]|uniref:lamin tail domain-containing protein 1 isoform X1 n=1 Tax=Lemur catta TaxID=9447 RepID=UPI001E26677E|nr:lamin tail domain-containing protein 1 isoform X1 [Lemur catta]XP_045410135.1 lamin tail domain-containing protein 1 isoform X1 [Lemur catta]